MKKALFFGGQAVIAAGAGLPLLLPSAPSFIQSNPSFQPIGVFIIDQQNWIVLFGLLMIVISMFVV